MEQNDFSNMRFPTYAKISCSPSLPREFRGLKISIPPKITVSKDKVIPVYGAFQISSKTNEKAGGKLIENTVLVFVNKETNKNFSFNLTPDKEPVDDPNTPLPQSTAEVAAEYTVRTYFNIDALQFYPDFPKLSATYFVYATVLDIKSEVVEVQISY